MSTTIGQRWAIHRRTSKHDINTHMEAVVVEFATAERELQRQECADAAEKWWDGDGTGRAVGEWWEELRKEILSAGTEPTNPYGCECGWKLDRHFNRWVLSTESVYIYSTSCDYCPKCGKAKRRET